MVTVKSALEFREPQLEDAKWMVPLLRQSGFMSCEYSFTTIYMWRKHYRNRIAHCGDALFMKSQEGESRSYLMPVGGDLKENIELLREFAHGQGYPLKLFGTDVSMIPQLEALFPGQFTFTPSRSDFDYIYNTSDLAQLTGKKYHGKRNHINSFSAKYDWQYERITDENCADVVAMAREWCRLKGNCAEKSLQSENCAIREVLAHREELSVTGGLIRVDGKVVAFTFASPINDQVVDIHVEKALPDYAGAYTVINREFAARELSGYRYINRENDMGIEGLRKAKESYNPAILLEKFICVETV